MTPTQKEKIIKLDPVKVFALALYGEARGASWEARVGMAQVMFNRLQTGRWGNNIIEVVTKNKQFSCFNDKDPNLGIIMGKVELWDSEFHNDQRMRECYLIALSMMNGLLRSKTVKDSLFYHTKAVDPSWNDDMELETQIGNTLFFKEKNVH